MRKEKGLLLDEIQEKIDSSEAMIVTSYGKLGPNASWELRELLLKEKAQFEVVKKRVFLKAAEKSGIEIDASLLEGHVGVMFVHQNDAMAPTKAMVKFSSSKGDLINVLCGRIEGKMLAGAEVVELSQLPSMDEMRAIMVGLFTSPMSHFLSVMEAIMAGPLSAIEKKSEQ